MLADNDRSETVTFSVAVAPANGDPFVDPVGHVIVTAGATVSVEVTLGDPDGDPLTLTASSGDPAVVAVSASSTAVMLPASATSTDILLNGVAEGVAEVTLAARDGGGATSTPVIFPVTVIPPPPAGVEGDFWVEPEVSGGQYTVRWDIRLPEGITADGTEWKLLEAEPRPGESVDAPPAREW